MPAAPPPPTPPTSLAARLLNVFATPTEVFDEVKSSPPRPANWLVPALLGGLLGVLAVWMLYSQPAFRQQMHERLASTYDGAVKGKKMSQAEADKAVALMERIQLPAGMAGAAVTGFVRIFWWAFILWLLARLFLKVRLGYLKVLEAAGLATMIGLLGDLVTFLLTTSLGKDTSPSLAMAVSDFNPKNPLHLAFAAANLFSFWIIGVMSLALARLAAVPFARAMFWVATYWVLLQFIIITLAAAVGSLAGMK
ncbi:MAG: YIP1 family protein [Verrucomicrobiota bacterium]